MRRRQQRHRRRLHAAVHARARVHRRRLQLRPAATASRCATTECDDGNTKHGDGCSPTASVETGFTCTDVRSRRPPAGPAGRLRDFKSHDAADARTRRLRRQERRRHRASCAACWAWIATTTAWQHRTGLAGAAPGPVYALAGSQTAARPTAPDLQPVVPRQLAIAKTVLSTMTVCDADQGRHLHVRRPHVLSARRPRLAGCRRSALVETLEGSSTPTARSAPAAIAEHQRDRCGGSGTTSASPAKCDFWFEYKGGEMLTFSGDDDVWVFVNGKLASTSVASTARQLAARVDALATLHVQLARSNRQGLRDGAVPRRAPHQSSNFKLTLGGFAKAASCTSTCGDGIVAVRRALRRRAAATPNGYGTCQTQLHGSDCAAVTASSTASVSEALRQRRQPERWVRTTAAAPDCAIGPRCGDEHVDAIFGETVRQRHAANDGSYGGCTARAAEGRTAATASRRRPRARSATTAST